MRVVAGQSQSVDGVLVHVEGGLSEIAVSTGSHAIALRGTRGTADLDELLLGSDMRIAAAIEVEVPSHALRLTQRDAGTTGDAVIVLEAPPLAGDERTHVALVEENGELQWVFASRGDRSFVIEVDPVATADRGLVGSVLKKAIKFIAIKAVAPLVRHGVRSLTAVIEKDKRRHRVRQFGPDNSRRADAPDATAESLRSGPALLLIHGTMGRTDQSFGLLDSEWVRALSDRYGGRVIAFDHPTLSVSPADNAEWFVEWLSGQPGDDGQNDALVFDVVAHSRGGLVARELLARANDQFSIRSVTFVATPNAGTPLCDGEHLGDFVDVWTNLLAVVPDNPIVDGLQVVIELVKDMALGIALDALPGLQAMRPDGAYLAELNGRPPAEGVELRAIAADFEPWSTSGLLRKLRDRLFDRVFEGAMNDLVVPTRSAYRQVDQFAVGVRQRMVLPSDLAVDHSSYWRNRDVLALLDRWLRAEQLDTPYATDPGTSDPSADLETAVQTGDGRRLSDAVKALLGAPDRILDAIKDATGGPVAPPPAGQAPVGDVIVLPGIMGSLLNDERGRIWIAPARLAVGDFARMSLDDPAATVTTVGLHPTYTALAARLARRWQVHLFPFDWRSSIEDAADALDRFVRDRVFGATGPRPVHLVAHSMGGLVARTFIGRHANTWAEMADGRSLRSGGRLVMLGTPNRGSYAIPLAIAGQDAMVKGLAAIDFGHDQRQLSQIMSTFTGMYQMLPSPRAWAGSSAFVDDRAHLYDTAGWGDVPVIKELLDRAGAFHEWLEQSHTPANATRMVYVAGDQRSTPARIRIEGGRHHFGQNDHGDGRVPHRSGVLDGVTTYYAPASHGGLVGDDAVLASLDELLEEGTTDRLASAPMPRRGVDVDVPESAPIDAPNVDPEPLLAITRGDVGDRRRDAGAVMAEATELYLGSPVAARTARPRLQVAVTHASLEQARFPVIVGHYRGIAPQGAEGFLDARLHGALTRHHRAGDYPGEIGETLYVASGGHRPPGGIVIGLGAFGELTRSKLARAVRCAVLQRLLSLADSGKSRATGISSVLISTPGQYGLSVGSAIAAIVEGAIDAVAEIERLGIDAELGHLEIVELYEIRAIEAVEALANVAAQLPSELQGVASLHVVGTLQEGRGGRGGLPTYNASGDGWPRFVIDRKLPPCPPRVKDEPDAESDADVARYPGSDGAPASRLPRLEFTRLGRSAQVDRLSIDFDDVKVRAMIDVAVRDPAAVDAGYALFQMLFPHNEKLEIEDTDNLHLLVDEDTAAIPWELLYGRGDGSPTQALALRAGLLRQLRPNAAGSPARRNGRQPVDLQALVVGDPPVPDFPRLDGARAEASLVAARLEQSGYTVERLIFDDDDKDPDAAWVAIQSALYKRPYRVLHFATHGFVDPDRPERTGLVIGQDRHLTAIDLRQMSVTPDLAFLNACHVGSTGSSPGLANVQARANALAANLGLQLMRNGVKAVVAAGWAVDDRSALKFAEAFYDQMLSGQLYGVATHQARKQALDGGRTNTWGAYQCYGDPSFHLVAQRRSNEQPVPVSPGRLVQMLAALGSKAADDDDIGALRRTHADVVELDDRDVTRFPHSEVYEELGRAYGALGCFADAVWAYEHAIAADRQRGWISPRSLEQLSSMQTHLAATAGMAPSLVIHHPNDTALDALFAAALTRLNALTVASETDERRRLLGSLAKKEASSHRVARSRQALASVALAEYRRAFAVQLAEAGTADPHSGPVWVQLAHIGPGGRPGEAAERRAARLVAQVIALEARPGWQVRDRPLLLKSLRDLMDVYPVPPVRLPDARRLSRPPRPERLDAAITRLTSASEDVFVDLKMEPSAALADLLAAGPAELDGPENTTLADLQLTALMIDPNPSAGLVQGTIVAYRDAFTNRSTMRSRQSVVRHLRDLVVLLGNDSRAEQVREIVEGLEQEL